MGRKLLGITPCETLLIISNDFQVSPVQGLEQHVFTPQERQDFVQKRGALTDYRKKIESGLNGQFGLFLKNTTVNNETHDYMVAQMKEKINDERLFKLIPDWSVGKHENCCFRIRHADPFALRFLGCRRLTPGAQTHG